MEPTTKELIETAIYELSRLARVMEIPIRGYTRNTYDSIQRTLAEALQNEDKKG